MIVYFHVNKNKYDRDMEILEICLSLYTENRSFIYMEREEINAFIYTANKYQYIKALLSFTSF